MPFYEHIVIARQDISQQNAEKLNDDIKAQLEKDGAKVAKIEYWGLRNLAYKVKKNRKGHYSLFAIECEPKAIKEVERQLSINEDVLRYLTIRTDELEDSPSVVMAKKDRDRERHSDREEA